ncbi:Zinc finger protein 271 [Eumeta japonica]|uniref:Zinc finger protein 271 n=1 Tax=Eumeta variegata TaxID=151549 RepID=A0A4C1XVY1_EUMVA|nr:Zinc finger protein 271 [Eumeta japonica]
MEVRKWSIRECSVRLRRCDFAGRGGAPQPEAVLAAPRAVTPSALQPEAVLPAPRVATPSVPHSSNRVQMYFEVPVVAIKTDHDGEAVVSAAYTSLREANDSVTTDISLFKEENNFSMKIEDEADELSVKEELDIKAKGLLLQPLLPLAQDHVDPRPSTSSADGPVPPPLWTLPAQATPQTKMEEISCERDLGVSSEVTFMSDVRKTDDVLHAVLRDPSRDFSNSESISLGIEQSECSYSVEPQAEFGVRTRLHALRKYVVTFTQKKIGTKPYKCGQCEYSASQLGSLKIHMRVHTDEKPYKCEHCEYRTSALGVLKIHTRSHTGEKPYKCEQCEYSTSYGNNLKTHMRSHTGEKPFKCDQCDYKSAHVSRLKIHMYTHTGEKPYRCEQCDYSASQLRSLNLHMSTHTGFKQYKCEQCVYSTSQLSNLKMHMRIHTGEKPYHCEQCDYSTSRANHLKIHMRTHTGEKPYECAQCGYRSSLLQHLKRHVRIHTGEKPYKCENCEYSSIQLENLKLHMRIHTGEKPYKCELCEYSTSRGSYLKMHMRSHTGEKPYKCELCEYSTSRGNNLTIHMRSHTGEKPYKCQLCEYSTSHGNNFKVHMHSHSGKKPYKCELCEYSTSRSYNLKVHMRSHTGEKPFKCDQCDYRSAHISQLKIHIRSHTGEKPYECELCEYSAACRRNLILHKHRRHKLTKDYAKAFEPISHESIWKALEDCNIPKETLELLKDIFEKSISRVKLERKGPEIKIGRGGVDPKELFSTSWRVTIMVEVSNNTTRYAGEKKKESGSVESSESAHWIVHRQFRAVEFHAMCCTCNGDFGSRRVSSYFGFSFTRGSKN